MIIKSFIKTSLVDYPGQVASTLFTGGCNFRCPWCHNQEIIRGNTSSSLSIEEIICTLKKRQNIVRHVCISGGEPTIWGEELIHLCTELKRIGLKIKLDTNGSNPGLISTLINRGYLDFIAMDFKNIPSLYAETVGLDVNPFPKIEKSIRIIRESGLSHQFRTTVVPGMVDPEAVRLEAEKYGIHIVFQPFRELI